MVAVGHADSFMVEFLISKGADVTRWGDMEDDIENAAASGIPCKNYYLEDIDLSLFNSEDEALSRALLETVKVLMGTGLLGDYTGLCLTIDSEAREITVGEKRSSW